jgi:hypothetical protein
VRTNIYELPLLSDYEVKTNRQRGIKNLSILEDHFMRNEALGCDNSENLLKEVTEAGLLFKSKQKSS